MITAAAAGLDQHAHRNFAGERAFALPMCVLRSNRNCAAARGLDRGGKRRERRSDDDVAMTEVSATSGWNASKNARVSACVLYIFQLPAITGRRNQGRPARQADLFC